MCWTTKLVPLEPDAPNPNVTAPSNRSFLSSAYPFPLPAAFKTACSTTAGKPNLVQILLQPCWFLSLFTSINFNGFPYINFVLNRLKENSYSLAFWRTAWVIFPCHIKAHLGSSGMTTTLCTLLRAINFPRLGEEDLHILEYTGHSLFSLGLGLCLSSRWKFLPPVQHGRELLSLHQGNVMLAGKVATSPSQGSFGLGSSLAI